MTKFWSGGVFEVWGRCSLRVMTPGHTNVAISHSKFDIAFYGRLYPFLTLHKISRQMVSPGTVTLGMTSCLKVRYQHTLYKLYAFLVRVWILGEAHPYSRWGCDSRWGTSPFPVRMFIPSWFIFTGHGDVPHRECT